MVNMGITKRLTPSRRPFFLKNLAVILTFLPAVKGCSQPAEKTAEWNEFVQMALDSLPGLTYERSPRLPLYLGRTGTGQLSDEAAENLLRELDKRGIGLACSWDQEINDEAISGCLTVARAQKKLKEILTPLYWETNVIRGEGNG